MAKPQPNFVLPARNGKRWAVGAMVILVIALAAFIANDFLANRIQSREFDGLVEHVNGDLVAVRGFYIVDGHPASRSGKGDEATIRVTPQTAFTLTTFALPEFGPNSTGTRNYDPNALLPTTASGTIRDLKPNLAVRVSAAGNIYEKPQFDVAAIDYSDVSFDKGKADKPMPSP